ncbi:MAG TPA: ABC transporter substrate-binding protein [Candidatus Binatia bacterium]|nr:ABC transporter substrate-binding protein [Candidatus Binatia bacterium]
MRIAETSVMIGLLLVAVACSGPAPTPPAPTSTRPLPKELLVGTSGDSPPYSTRRAGTIAGLEPDLALEIGKVLDRPVRIVNVPWDGLFDALGDGKVDVVMAGVTVTPERERRFAFTEPYLQTGIVMLIRGADRKRFGSLRAICKRPHTVGVVAKSTGEAYVHDRCSKIDPVVYVTADDAVLAVASGRNDTVVHDAPVLAYLRAQQAVELDLVPLGINDEKLAWMVRQNDTALLQALNGALATLRQNGTLDRVLERWIPNLEQVRAH